MTRGQCTSYESCILKILHLLHSEPDETVIDLIASISGREGATVVSLYPDDVAHIPVDWSRVVDDVMSHEKNHLLVVTAGYHDMKTLGMIITSDRYPDQVWSLARTANEKKLAVRIHLTGPGVRLIHQPGFRQLAQWAAVTVCNESATFYLPEGCLGNEYPQWIAQSNQMARLIAECDRHLVF